MALQLDSNLAITRHVYDFKVACGDSHSAIMQLGRIFLYGNRANGKLGIPVDNANMEPIMHHPEPLATKDAIQVSCGVQHTAYVDEKGVIYTFGQGDRGQLGHLMIADRINRIEPMPRSVASLSGIVEVACGAYHTLALSKDGHVWAWGAGTYGQLGIGEKADSKVPMQVKVPADNVLAEGTEQRFKAVAAGRWHSCALMAGQDESGQRRNLVYQWGWVRHTHETQSSALYPILVPELMSLDVARIGAGGFHSGALTQQGVLYAWGVNSAGQLGVGRRFPACDVPMQVKVDTPPEEDSQSNPEPFKLLRFCFGDLHSACIDSHGRLFTFGNNEFGQCAHPILDGSDTILTPRLVSQPYVAKMYVVDVACGQFHTEIITSGFREAQKSQVGLPNIRKIQSVGCTPPNGTPSSPTPLAPFPQGSAGPQTPTYRAPCPPRERPIQPPLDRGLACSRTSSDEEATRPRSQVHRFIPMTTRNTLTATRTNGTYLLPSLTPRESPAGLVAPSRHYRPRSGHHSSSRLLWGHTCMLGKGNLMPLDPVKGSLRTHRRPVCLAASAPACDVAHHEGMQLERSGPPRRWRRPQHPGKHHEFRSMVRTTARLLDAETDTFVKSPLGTANVCLPLPPDPEAADSAALLQPLSPKLKGKIPRPGTSEAERRLATQHRANRGEWIDSLFPGPPEMTQQHNTHESSISQEPLHEPQQDTPNVFSPPARFASPQKPAK